MEFAIIKDDAVINSIVADNIEIAKSIFPEFEVIEINSTNKISYGYKRINDKWMPPAPYDSWLFNFEKWEWESSIPYPNDGKDYAWNEDSFSWELVVQ